MQPAEGTLDDPATRFPARSGIDAVLAASAQVQDITLRLDKVAGLGVIVALVQTKAMIAGPGRRPVRAEFRQGFLQQLMIVPICAGHHHA